MPHITHSHLDQVTAVAVAGRLDALGAPDLERKLEELLKDGRTLIVVDFDGVEFIASAGLRVFLSHAKKLKKAGGQLALARLRRDVLGVFEMSGFTEIFPIFAAVEEAARALKS